tara:strand:- start:157 stop:384 length:228 start_codon:yes stop_codon:yes gene_type:complete
MSELKKTHISPEKKTYAKVVWDIIDVMDGYDVTEEEAHEFLQRNENRLQDIMIERGWDAIDTYADMDGLKKRKGS